MGKPSCQMYDDASKDKKIIDILEMISAGLVLVMIGFLKLL